MGSRIMYDLSNYASFSDLNPDWVRHAIIRRWISQKRCQIDTRWYVAYWILYYHRWSWLTFEGINGFVVCLKNTAYNVGLQWSDVICEQLLLLSSSTRSCYIMLKPECYVSDSKVSCNVLVLFSNSSS